MATDEMTSRTRVINERFEVFFPVGAAVNEIIDRCRRARHRFWPAVHGRPGRSEHVQYMDTIAIW